MDRRKNQKEKNENNNFVVVSKTETKKSFTTGETRIFEVIPMQIVIILCGDHQEMQIQSISKFWIKKKIKTKLKINNRDWIRKQTKTFPIFWNHRSKIKVIEMGRVRTEQWEKWRVDGEMFSFFPFLFLLCNYRW